MKPCRVYPWYVFASSEASRRLACAVIADKVATAMLVEAEAGEDE